MTKKISIMPQEELLALAKELGVELTEDDFGQKGEVDDELDVVSGGWKGTPAVRPVAGSAREEGGCWQAERTIAFRTPGPEQIMSMVQQHIDCGMMEVSLSGGSPAQNGEKRCRRLGTGNGCRQ